MLARVSTVSTDLYVKIYMMTDPYSLNHELQMNHMAHGQEH